MLFQTNSLMFSGWDFFSFLLEPNWWTTLIVYVVIIIGLYIILSAVLKKYHNRKKILIGYKYVVYCFLLMEGGLRLSGLYYSYFEKKGGKYESLYKYRPKEALHKRGLNDTFWMESQNEFKFRFTTNSQGYSDGEWRLKDGREFRILALGDSFTEGFGAEQNRSWVAQISKSDTTKELKWYNGGISASDPFTNFFALENELYKLKPDMVVQIYTSQDFEEDVLLRGGMERFKNKQLSYKEKPKREIFYAYSHIFRMIYKLKSGRKIFIPVSELKKNNPKSSFAELVKNYNNWAEKHQITVVLIFFHTSSYYYSAEDYVSEIDLGSKRRSKWLMIKSLSDCYRKEYLNKGETFNLLWWENDGHHNAQGYQMMAKCIEEVIRPVIDSVYQVKINQ